MKINDFSSFFEILAGLNVIYASFENIFNYTLNNRILVASDLKIFLRKLRRLVKAEYATSNFSEDSADFNDHPELVKDYDALSKYINDFSKFPKSFKPLFLLCFFYCIVVLILGGFDYDFSNLFIMSVFIIIVGIYHFWRSYDEIHNNKPLDANLIFLLFIPFAVSSCFFNIEINDNTAAFISCLAGASAFIFCFVRATIYNLKVLFYVTNIRKHYPEISKKNDDFKFLQMNEDRGYFEMCRQTYRHLQKNLKLKNQRQKNKKNKKLNSSKSKTQENSN